jgi:hypothetical protein
MANQPSTVSELYPSKWLRAEDLRPGGTRAKIVKVEVQELRQRDGTMKQSAVLTFEHATKQMICNVTQCRALATILESERFADWPGHTVCLVPAVASNGKGTIEVQAP